MTVRVNVDRCDPACLPVFQRHGIWRIGTEECEPFLEVVETRSIGSYRVQEISHWRVIRAVTDQHQVEKTSCVIDEIGDNTPPQIEFTKILVRKHKLRITLGI